MNIDLSRVLASKDGFICTAEDCVRFCTYGPEGNKRKIVALCLVERH